MVLSNKKLKQKLRAAKAELIVASEAQNTADNNSKSFQGLDSETAESLRTILNPDAQKPRLSKREKLRPKVHKATSDITKNGEMSDDAKENKEGSKSDVVEVKEKKKRKRDESEAPESVMEKKPQQKKKKNTKKKKKPKKKVEDVKVKEEEVKQMETAATGEQLAAKTDESSDRKNVEISSRVYVGGIPYYSTEDDIRSYFEGCGTITSIDCMTFPDTGKFRGIAIISFKTEAAAKRALALDGSDMGGLFLKIQPFKAARVNKSSNFSPSVLEGYNRIYIGNLSWDVTEEDLKKLFADCTISSIRFGEDKETREFKGYAHVDFANGISLNMALKLDQTIVCGRPVRISCAVPKKASATKSSPMPKDNQVDSGNNVSAANENQVTSIGAVDVSSKIQGRSCYECGERGHLSSSCPKKLADVSLSRPKKQADDDSTNPGAIIENQVTSIGADAMSSKIKRRSCYECGERGHLSSSCPKKQADLSSSFLEKHADVSSSWPKKQADDDLTNPDAINENQVTSIGADAMSSKIKRRSCYECGERGHLSSSCPKKQADISSSFPEKQADLSSSHPKKQADVSSSWQVKEGDYSRNPGAANENQVTSNGVDAVNAKIRRRSCYECGERGHLSSSCPNKKADLSSSFPEKQADLSSSFPEKQDGLSSSWPNKQIDDLTIPGAVNENQVIGSGGSAINSKIRRRTCYECGERGHLSSSCPKQAGDSTNPGFLRCDSCLTKLVC